jgi:hypothetical protein
MKLFLIEAYGGPTGTDGAIHHFTVRATSLDQAIGLVRNSDEGGRFGRFDLIEESAEFTADTPAIIEAGDGGYLEPSA